MTSAQPQPQHRIKPSSVVYWSRFLLAICAAFAIRFLGINETTLGDLAMVFGIGIGILFYILSVLLVRHVFRYGEADLKGKNKDVTLGGGTYVMVWIMITVLLNTVL